VRRFVGRGRVGSVEFFDSIAGKPDADGVKHKVPSARVADGQPYFPPRTNDLPQRVPLGFSSLVLAVPSGLSNRGPTG
ncbi:MAG: hypothetical protein KA923_01830, partial [Opitutaceae bacterium]|nr:hypothetical protein [Opitutaceae bacterium]